MKLLNSLFDGKVGTIRKGRDWDEENEVLVFEKKEWEVVDEVGDIDEFFETRDVNNVILFKSDGYRGKGCYSGWYKEDGKVYNLDIMNEYVVCEMEELV